MSLLGLDVGTTGCKAIVFRVDGQILGQSYREYPLKSPQDGWLELDTYEVFKAAKDTIRKAVAKAASYDDPVKAISTSAQGEAVTPVSAGGDFLANSIVSSDNRTIPQANWWKENLGAKDIFQITGIPLHPMCTLNKIMWWKENRPDIFQKTWKFLCYGDLILYKLGGKPAIDPSMAARTMAMDLRARKWSKKILDLAGIREDQLAEIHESGETIGTINPEIAEELGLPKDVKLVAGGHDQPCGALGASIVDSGVAMDATGTVECITPAFDHPVLTDGMLAYNYCCYPHVVPGLYVTLAFNFTGGSLLKWYRDTLGSAEVEESEVSGLNVYDIIVGNAAKGPSNVMVLPHFTSTGTPWFDSKSRGAILGLTLSTGKDEIIKGILDGLTYEIKLNLEYLKKAGVPIKRLRAIGGGAKSRIWMQLKANIWNLPVAALDISEAACLGAAILAGKGCGVYPDVAEAARKLVKERNVFEPNPQQVDGYEEKFRLYEQIYPLMKDFMHQL